MRRILCFLRRHDWRQSGFTKTAGLTTWTIQVCGRRYCEAARWRRIEYNGKPIR